MAKRKSPPLTPLQALEKAVRVLGGQSALAAVCGGKIRQQHVYNWLNRDKALPADYAVKVHRATAEKGDTVFAHELCPNSFNEGDISEPKVA
jgi:DNA-binding transcriptional regulator YdaS (Cro superfamily)